MYIHINDTEEINHVYTTYVGRVVGIETLVKSTIHGGTVASGGKEFSMHATSIEVKKAKVVLPNGRIKEFDTEGIEMQEGDEVEFTTAENGKCVFVKNATTGDSDVAEPYYIKSEVVPWAAMACLASICYGVYSIFWRQSFLLGLAYFAAGTITMTLMYKFRSASIKKSNANFQEKIKATGATVTLFKAVNDEFKSFAHIGK